ncbi:MAG: DUF885 domain-containing protein [Pseudomonadota bacterium]|nr:MAG: DUF885 domain-containing protein [Pseudomonadota bacterium]
MRLVSLAGLALFVLVACRQESPVSGAAGPAGQADSVGPDVSTEQAAPAHPEAAFEVLAQSLIDDMLTLNPEWAIYQGDYAKADRLTIPDAEYRGRADAFLSDALARLADFDRLALSPHSRADYDLLENHLRSMQWYLNTYRGWEWQPSRYNVAGPIGVLLNTEFAPLEQRLVLIGRRLDNVQAYYDVARRSLQSPTLQHTELAIRQNQGALALFESIATRAAAAELSNEQRRTLDERIASARSAVIDWIGWLERLRDELADAGHARSFRLGEMLYEQKFALDIQSAFSAAELYQRALAEKARLHAEMDELAVELWPRYFPDEPLPDAPLERISGLIERLSDEQVPLEGFIDEIRRQIPRLAEFVRANRLLEQDPDKPLVVRETPEYMRGTGAIASVSAPGPFNPGAETYYNVTPLESYGPDQAASYLREYNQWMLQILNIHEAIPGHYTQLLHANRSPSLVKSLFGNGAMIEGWAVYAERMMLEQGWGDHAPELWLMHGKWLLRVVSNAILDYSVHVLGMERDEALRMMQEEAFQERSEAEQKWLRVTLSQVQLTSYYAGYAEIRDLRERRRQIEGDAFDLEAFHNEFLSFGSAPVATIAELMTD